MKTRSAKAKGRRLARFIKEKIMTALTSAELEDDDIIVTPAGVNGPDLQISPAGKKVFPFDVECKNVERLNIWGAINQLLERGSEFPMLVFGKNRTEPWIAVPYDTFLAIYKIALEKKDQTPHE